MPPAAVDPQPRRDSDIEAVAGLGSCGSPGRKRPSTRLGLEGQSLDVDDAALGDEEPSADLDRSDAGADLLERAAGSEYWMVPSVS